MSAAPIKKTEAVKHLAAVLRATLRAYGVDPAEATDADIADVWDEERRAVAPGTHGAAWIAVMDAWCEATLTSRTPAHRRLYATVRRGF